MFCVTFLSIYQRPLQLNLITEMHPPFYFHFSSLSPLPPPLFTSTHTHHHTTTNNASPSTSPSPPSHPPPPNHHSHPLHPHSRTILLPPLPSKPRLRNLRRPAPSPCNSRARTSRSFYLHRSSPLHPHRSTPIRTLIRARERHRRIAIARTSLHSLPRTSSSAGTEWHHPACIRERSSSGSTRQRSSTCQRSSSSRTAFPYQRQQHHHSLKLRRRHHEHHEPRVVIH